MYTKPVTTTGEATHDAGERDADGLDLYASSIPPDVYQARDNTDAMESGALEV
jgi:hypothetical protein